jgi:hypothetical protein
VRGAHLASDSTQSILAEGVASGSIAAADSGGCVKPCGHRSVARPRARAPRRNCQGTRAHTFSDDARCATQITFMAAPSARSASTISCLRSNVILHPTTLDRPRPQPR